MVTSPNPTGAAHGRPVRLVVVAGTGTELGTTWVAVRVLEALRSAGWSVAARKPAQSTDPGEVTDAEVLAAASGEPVERVCPGHRTYEVAMAPPMAAAALGLTPATIGELADEIERSWGGMAADVGLVELAGGVASPLAADGDGATLIAALEPDLIVLVAHAGLGTINDVRLSTAAIGVASTAPVRVVLNRFDPLDPVHRANLDWLVGRDGFEVVTDAAAASTWVIGDVARFCGYCGSASATCAGDCRRPLDPDRFCVRCGRRLVVSISPAGHHARCRVHGAID